MDANKLAKIVTGQRGGRGSNSRPLSHQSDTLVIDYRVIPFSYIFNKSSQRSQSNSVHYRLHGAYTLLKIYDCTEIGIDKSMTDGQMDRQFT